MSPLERAKSHRWFHQIKLTEEFTTPGIDNTPLKLAQLDELGLAQDLSGKRVLDIGAWDGFFTFEMERRGAEVLAIDHVEQSVTGFPIAAEALNSSAQWKTLNIYKINPETVGQFDLVLCLGVIYHLRHPLLALDNLRSVLKEDGEIFVETHAIDTLLLKNDGTAINLANSYPEVNNAALLQLYPRDELNADTTNFFAPNLSGLKALLEACEFEPLSVMAGSEHFPTRALAHARAIKDEKVSFYRKRDQAELEDRKYFETDW